jgi:hypothetical protein
MRRLLRVPSDQAPIDESETHRIFSASIFLSALRCLLSYIVLPVLLPAIGLARGVGPAIGIPVSILALTFDYLGIRRFWLADHRQRWAFSALYAVVGTMVFALLISDIVELIH